MKLGNFAIGLFKPMDPNLYLSLGAVSVHDQVYELRIETTHMSFQQEGETADRIMHMWVPGMKVLGVEAKGSTVRMQVQANQFEWAALFAVLPALIGPIFGFIIGVIVLSKINEWTMPLIILAGVGIATYMILKPNGRKNKE